MKRPKGIGINIPLLCLLSAFLVLFGKTLLFERISYGKATPAGRSHDKQDIITIHYHERSPYYMTGPLGIYGLCSDPVKIAFRKAGVKFRWQKTPAKRQLELLGENRAKECIVGWFKTSEREAFAKYSHYLYQDKPTIALARADNAKIISNRRIEETLLNENLILLRKNGYSYGRFIDSMISQFKPRQEITNSKNIGMLEMIYSGRADYFFISEEEALILTSTSGLLKTDFKFIKFTNVPDGNKRYLLFSKNVDNKVIDKIDEALAKYISNES